MIGHSNGAEYNHYLFLEENNPFSGFISISTNFYGKRKNKNVDKEMGEAISKINDSFYYFVANGTSDSPDRIEAGNTYEKLYEANKNPNFKFQKKTYKRGHNSMVPSGLFDAIKFVYKDYKQLDNYITFKDYRDKFKSDMKNLYGIEITYNIYDLDNIIGSIFENKNVEDLEACFQFVEDEKLWQSPVMKAPGGLDPANKGNMYFQIQAYEKSAEAYEKALEELGITAEPMVYFGNFSKAVQSLKEIKAYDRLVTILINTRDALLDYKDLYPKSYKSRLLKLNYQIAKLSAEHKIAKKEGKKALTYCKDNFEKNKFFTEEELKALR